jgi:hypothetical protein
MSMTAYVIAPELCAARLMSAPLRSPLAPQPDLPTVRACLHGSAANHS